MEDLTRDYWEWFMARGERGQYRGTGRQCDSSACNVCEILF